MNTKILSFENIELDAMRREVNVDYTLEGDRKRLDVPFDHLTNFLTQHRVKVAGYNDEMGIEELDILWWSEQTLENTAQAFIRNYEKFDLIVENRKLMDQVARHESAMKFAKCCVVLLNGLQKESEKFISGSNWLDNILPNYNKHMGLLMRTIRVKTMIERIIKLGEGDK